MCRVLTLRVCLPHPRPLRDTLQSSPPASAGPPNPTCVLVAVEGGTGGHGAAGAASARRPLGFKPLLVAFGVAESNSQPATDWIMCQLMQAYCASVGEPCHATWERPKTTCAQSYCHDYKLLPDITLRCISRDTWFLRNSTHSGRPFACNFMTVDMGKEMMAPLMLRVNGMPAKKYLRLVSDCLLLGRQWPAMPDGRPAVPIVYDW